MSYLFGPALAGRSPTPLAAGKRRDFCQLRSADGASRRSCEQAAGQLRPAAFVDLNKFP
jgi:hypothetical protein